MHLNYENVNDAFVGLVEGIYRGTIPTVVTSSRAGEVATIEEPVLITYKRPTQRVLFNTARDCNPFFHLFESLWMLAGRNDLASLQYFVSNFDNFSDNGTTLNGAYGYRWRHSPINDDGTNVDQLELLVKHLKKYPNTRRAVLQMWNVKDDLLRVDDESEHGYSKDVCCNTNAYFRVVYGDKETNGKVEHEVPRWLDMTVCNRSNDLIWGALGANVVHFSFLQEYLACRLGLDVGVYNQFTNNLHVYLDRWDPDKWLAGTGDSLRTMHDPKQYNYRNDVIAEVPFTAGDREIRDFVDDRGTGSYETPFLRDVAYPAIKAFSFHKEKDYEAALAYVGSIRDDAWKIACTNWIKKRKENWEKKNAN